MKIAAFADEIDRTNPVRAMQLAARWGLRAVEIRTLPGGRFPRVADDELGDLGRIVADAGLTVSGVSPGLFKCAITDAAVETGITELLPRSCDWARAWGTQRVSIFGFARGDDPHGSGNFPSRVVDTLGRMCDVAVAAGCHLVLENEAVCWGDTGRSAAALIRAVGTERLAMCWDPGNSARAGDTAPLLEYAGLADLVTHVHLKNFDPEISGWSLMDTGVVDWAGQFGALGDDGYTGYLVIETHTSIEPDGVEPSIDAGETLAPLEANTLRNLQYTRALLG
ncbi:uncharacterized protein METZ01_LOCUS241072 [marine metagenome]|uniref:Xylose isomerase-like TIM barrel domain-containing protein n=1 Tax=marine metagenome TaxID=408172 RepID=A0A382HLN9_9ZZZZ